MNETRGVADCRATRSSSSIAAPLKITSDSVDKPCAEASRPDAAVLCKYDATVLECYSVLLVVIITFIKYSCSNRFINEIVWLVFKIG